MGTRIWKYLWYKPIFFYYKDENRWYVSKRKTTWLLILPIIIFPLFVYGGLKGVKDYIKNLFKINATWILDEKNISFKRKLSIVYYITKNF